MDISYFGNPNPSNPYHHHYNNIAPSSSSSDFINLSDYLLIDDVVFVDHSNSNNDNNNNQDQYYSSWSQSSETEQSSDKAASSSTTTTTDVVINQGLISDETSINKTTKPIKRKNEGIKENTVQVCQKITFRTRSQLEIMDDGYKWRKYGKKSVKNSPNPRNYYKCSGERCGVKKRVERDREDSNYVLTTYEGVHTHESPCTSYYTTPLSSNFLYSNQWPSTNSSSSN